MDRTKEELMFILNMKSEREQQLFKRWERYRSTGQSSKATEIRYELKNLVEEIVEICDILDSKYNLKVIKNIYGKLEFIDKE